SSVNWHRTRSGPQLAAVAGPGPTADDCPAMRRPRSASPRAVTDLARTRLPGTFLAGTAALPAQAITVPNDPLFLNTPQCQGVQNCVNQQWNLMSDGRGISADSAWDLTKGNHVTIAVLDSGIDPTHEDLVNQLVNGYDFYQNDNDPTDGTGFGHGTGTAGVAGAEQGNAKGGTGVAPGAKIMPLRVSDTFIVAPTRLAQAIVYATDHGANVISMSVGL